MFLLQYILNNFLLLLYTYTMGKKSLKIIICGNMEGPDGIMVSEINQRLDCMISLICTVQKTKEVWIKRTD